VEGSDAGLGKVQPLRRSDAEREQQLWTRLRDAESPEGWYGAWLGLQCGAIGEVRCGLALASRRPGGPLEHIATWPDDGRKRRHLVAAAERVVAERRALALQLGPQGRAGEPGATHTVVARPVESGDAVVAVVALEVSARPTAELEQVLRQLAWGSGLIQHYEGGGAVKGGRTEQLAQLLDLLAAVFEHERFRTAATAFATDLAGRFGCERASLGFLERGQVQLAAVSHSSQFDRRANLTRAAEAAMSETLDQEAPVLWPAPLDAPPRVGRAQAELARLSGAGSVATFPIAHGDEFAGALTLERAGTTPLAPSERELVTAALAFAGPHLEVLRREDRWLGRKAVDATRGQLARLVGPRHVAFKLATGTVLALFAFLALAHGEYRVSADTLLEASVLRAASAPFDGYVTEAPVRAGDVVNEGDLLARLDDRDLLLEQHSHGSQLLQLRKQRRQALAEQNAAQAEILSAQIDQAAARLSLVEDQLARTRLTAPFDGIVVSGDLSQELGSPVARGDLLFELAPLDSYRVVLMVDEREIDEIARGQTGSIAFFAFPNQRFEIQVDEITPISEASEGHNRFRVEASLEAGAPGHLRPGMEGIGRRRMLWIWSHEMLDWLRLLAWSWLP
jgi:multidrug resistance efflux pump